MNYLSMLMLKSYFLSENETCVGVERIKFKLKGQLETWIKFSKPEATQMI